MFSKAYSFQKVQQWEGQYTTLVQQHFGRFPHINCCGYYWIFCPRLLDKCASASLPQKALQLGVQVTDTFDNLLPLPIQK